MPGVSSGDGCLTTTGDGCNLTVRVADRQTCRPPAGAELGIDARGLTVKGQNASCEILLEHILDCGSDPITPPARWQGSDA